MHHWQPHALYEQKSSLFLVFPGIRQVNYKLFDRRGHWGCKKRPSSELEIKLKMKNVSFNDKKFKPHKKNPLFKHTVSLFSTPQAYDCALESSISLLCYSPTKHLSTFQKRCLCFIYNDWAMVPTTERGYKWCEALNWSICYERNLNSLGKAVIHLTSRI